MYLCPQAEKERKMRSWKAEVIADRSGEWRSNALRFATKQEALDNAADLASRWTLVRDWRAVESDEPPNYTYHNRQLRHIEGAS